MGIRKYLTGGWMSSDVLLRDEPEPLEGTRMDLFNSQIPAWYQENWSTSGMFLPLNSLADKVWVASRCKQLNAQQIAAMPLEWHGSNGAQEPAWIASPDPTLFPNGIGDAAYCITDNLYGDGYSIQVITDRYDTGYPRRWTVLDPAACVPRWGEDGRREYKLGNGFLDPGDVVQIDRNPTTDAHGTASLAAFTQAAWGLLAAQNQSLFVTQGGTAKFYLKSEKRLTKEQAETLQTQWMTAAERRGAAPPVVPPEVTPMEMSFNPAELALLENQEWSARTIAAAYGVPSVILNMALQGGLTYQNPMALMQMWWLTELRPTAKRIVDAFTAQMLPRGQWVSVDASDITSETLNENSADDDPQLSQVANASPAQAGGLTAIGGGRP